MTPTKLFLDELEDSVELSVLRGGQEALRIVADRLKAAQSCAVADLVEDGADPLYVQGYNDALRGALSSLDVVLESVGRLLDARG